MNAGLTCTTLDLLAMVVRAGVFFFPSILNFFFPTSKLFFLGQAALADAGIPYSAVKQACVGYVYGEYCCLGRDFCDNCRDICVDKV